MRLLLSALMSGLLCGSSLAETSAPAPAIPDALPVVMPSLAPSGPPLGAPAPAAFSGSSSASSYMSAAAQPAASLDVLAAADRKADEQQVAQVLRRPRPGEEPVDDTLRGDPRQRRGAPVSTERSRSYEDLQTRGDIVPVPDRWRILEGLGIKGKWYDPYNNNVLKGDKPVYGKDGFVLLNVISDTVYEPRAFPVPVGFATTSRPGTNDLFGKPDQYVFSQNLITNLTLIKGDTAFKPPDLELRITPVFNYNYVKVKELGLVRRNPELGKSRSDRHVGMQELFLDYHIRNVSERYDFDSIRVGIQPFNADFRGFLFLDNQPGVRLFGTRNNNIFQYNLAWFRRLEKDTNSGLNDLGKKIRDDDIFIGNLYWQDFPVLGFTSQVTAIYNRNTERKTFLDSNGFLQRPAILGQERPRDYKVGYLGYNGDGHFGRYNLTVSGYHAYGQEDGSIFTEEKSDISAWFFAAEPSIDYSWTRLRGSLLYASGDKDPFDDKSKGFSSIFENPQFAGADTSFWIRQNIPLIGGGGVTLSPRNGLIPDLRSSKEHGQSNFVNPGLQLVGGGADFDMLPQLRLSANMNHLRFNETEVLEVLRNEGGIRSNIGWDMSASAIYRPLMTQNVVFRLSYATLLPGKGFKDLYHTENEHFYTLLANLTLAY
ncbi:MAG: hypothetical protein Dbin4_00442 [Alphaproteobacteria bacterium]|nr:hypothetical protein [Alphaproteobacteria bacterium]